MRETEDELLGVHAAQHRTLADFGSFAFLMTTSGTLGGAVDECAMFQQLLGESFSIARLGDQLGLRYRRIADDPPAQRHVIEMAAFDWAMNLGVALRQPVRASRVRFCHAPPPWGPAALEAAFGCPVELGAACDEIVFPAEVMSLPMPHADPDLHESFARHARERLARIPSGDLLARVHAAIAARLGDRALGLDELASELAIAPRTLQRRLHASGATLQGLVDDARRDRAIELLAAELPVFEVSDRLGYSEPAAFHRAFKRWTGPSPDAFRARAAAR